MLLLPATLIKKHYSPKHVEFHACPSISKPQTNWPKSLLVAFLVKLRLTSLYVNFSLNDPFSNEHYFLTVVRDRPEKFSHEEDHSSWNCFDPQLKCMNPCISMHIIYPYLYNKLNSTSVWSLSMIY